MFGKEFKDDETDPVIPAVPKKDVKEFAKEIFIEVPKPTTAISADSFIEKVKSNPEDPAVLEDCDVETFNKVYNALKNYRLHNACVWDEGDSILRYK
tara:strand:+ start:235 stop:525 length:291 start_codon:yes stop_codon:yes gene_type:complete